jgi:hypothetical protein
MSTRSLIIRSGATLFCCLLSSAALIAAAYDLFKAPPPFPFRDYRQEVVAVFHVALVSTCFLSWIIFSGSSGVRSFTSLLVAILKAQASLTIYGLLGWRLPSTWINPSTFFAEYNWLTFILEVSPPLSIISGMLLFALVWTKRPSAQS